MLQTELHNEVLRTTLENGPADGREILASTQSTNDTFQAVYWATRSSQYAETWRIMFGQDVQVHGQQQQDATSILKLTVASVSDMVAGGLTGVNQDLQSLSYALRIVANCCADNNPNRQIVIDGKVVMPLMQLMDWAILPDVVIPTLYNVCSGYDVPAHEISAADDLSSYGDLVITEVEIQIARSGATGDVFAGLQVLLNAQLVLGCPSSVRDYLTELVEMAARPTIIQRFRNIVGNDSRGIEAMARLLASDGGAYLAACSLSCRVHVCRALLAVSTSESISASLAETGDIYALAWMAYADFQDLDYARGEDDDEIEDNMEALGAIQTSILKQVYEVIQMPQFQNPPKYGIARSALGMLSGPTAYLKVIALLMLYGFVDNDVRATLVVNEGLLTPLISSLRHETDKLVLHPAVGLAAKLAVTWRLRKQLVEGGILRATQHLILGPNLGFEIPQNTVMLIELLIKGHQDHAVLLISSPQSREVSEHTLMEDLIALFKKGHDTVNLEISRLIIELCSTLALSNGGSAYLDRYVACIDQNAWAQILTFAGTRAQTADLRATERVWLALGLLSTTVTGKKIVIDVINDPQIQSKVQELSQSSGTPAAENVKFMLFNMSQDNEQEQDQSQDLNKALEDLQLG